MPLFFHSNDHGVAGLYQFNPSEEVLPQQADFLVSHLHTNSNTDTRDLNSGNFDLES